MKILLSIKDYFSWMVNHQITKIWSAATYIVSGRNHIENDGLANANERETCFYEFLNNLF